MAPGAPGMGTQSETCGCCSNFCRKESKKASRVMCGGAMQSVSMSLPGCTTPNLPKTSSRASTCFKRLQPALFRAPKAWSSASFGALYVTFRAM